MSNSTLKLSGILESAPYRLERVLPAGALLLAGLAMFSVACGPGSNSPTEPAIEGPRIVTVDSNAAEITTSKGVAVGGVIGVDETLRVILLDTERQIMVGASTKWDRRGNLHSFPKLVSAFNQGSAISVKARGVVNRVGDVKAETIKAIVR
jgi:hypothetical protein